MPEPVLMQYTGEKIYSVTECQPIVPELVMKYGMLINTVSIIDGVGVVCEAGTMWYV